MPTANHTHGGARPKVRDDDGRRNNQPPISPGRPPAKFTLKLDDGFAVLRSDKDGNGILPADVWQVIEITRTHVQFRNNTGDTIRLIR